MSRVIVSTTDTVEEVKAAMGGDAEETPVEETPSKEEEPSKSEEPEKGDETESAAETDAAKKKPKEAKDDEEIDEDALPKGVKKTLAKLRQQRRELRERVDDLEGKPAAKTPESAPAPKKADAPEQPLCGRPKPKLADYSESDDPYAALADALGEWHADEKIARKELNDRTEAAKSERETLIEKHAERTAVSKERYPDFDAVMEELGATVMLTPAMQHIVLNSDVGPDINYYFLKNPDRAKEIAEMDGADQLVAMGEIRAEVRQAVAAIDAAKGDSKEEEPADKTKETPKQKPLPPPIKPVGARGSAPSQNLQDLAEKGDFKAYEARRKAQGFKPR